MRFNRLVTLAAFLCGGLAFAEGSKVAVQVNYSNLTYGATTTSTKVGSGTAEDIKSTAIMTSPAGIEVVATWDKMTLHTYPHNDGADLRFGYLVMDNIEAGLIFGYSSSTTDKATASEAKKKDSGMNIGLFGWYGMPAGPGTLELNAEFVSKSENEDHTDSAGTQTKSTNTGSSYAVSAVYVFPLAGGFSYTPALSYAGGSTKNKEADATVSTSTLGLTLCGVRYDF